MWSEIFVANTTDGQDLRPHVQRYGQPFRKVGGTMDGCMIANLVDRIFSCSEPAVKSLFRSQGLTPSDPGLGFSSNFTST